VPGPATVTVTDVATGDAVVLEDAFTYVGEGPTTTTSSTTTTTTRPGSPTTTTTTTTLVGEITTTTTTLAITTSTTAPTTTTTTIPVSADPSAEMQQWLADTLITPDTELAELPGDDPFAAIAAGTWSTELCEDPVCDGWVVRTDP
jgi:hypothetical protein